MITVYVRPTYREMTTEMLDWLCDNIGPEGTRYYTETAAMQMVEVEEDQFLPTRHFAATFDYEDDAVLFRLRWS